MKVIILAGGNGTRLWPFSRQSLPKQFLHFGDEQSLLQKTLLRFSALMAPEDIWIIANQEYRDLVNRQATALDPRYAQQILVEPERKNTGPAIAFAMKYLQEVERFSDEECVLVAASDHLISPVEVFLEQVKLGFSVAAQGKHVLFGVHPDRADTGYGYVKGFLTSDPGVWQVERFVEKPDAVSALSYVQSREYLWNAGIFIFQMRAFWTDLKGCCPEIGYGVDFSEMPSLSIDCALMERSKNIMMVPLDLQWSDMGSWDNIYAVMEKDQNANVKRGNILDVDTKNCLIIGGKRLISTIGLEDVLIIETEDALFIGKKGESQQIKQLVEDLKKNEKVALL